MCNSHDGHAHGGGCCSSSNAVGLPNQSETALTLVKGVNIPFVGVSRVDGVVEASYGFHIRSKAWGRVVQSLRVDVRIENENTIGVTLSNIEGKIIDVFSPSDAEGVRVYIESITSMKQLQDFTSTDKDAVIDVYCDNIAVGLEYDDYKDVLHANILNVAQGDFTAYLGMGGVVSAPYEKPLLVLANKGGN